MSPDHYSYTVYADPADRPHLRRSALRRADRRARRRDPGGRDRPHGRRHPRPAGPGRRHRDGPRRSAAGSRRRRGHRRGRVRADAGGRPRARARGRTRDHLRPPRRARARVPGPFVRCRGQPADADALAAMARGAVGAVPRGVAPGDLRLPLVEKRGAAAVHVAADLRPASARRPNRIGSSRIATSRPRSAQSASRSASFTGSSCCRSRCTRRSARGSSRRRPRRCWSARGCCVGSARR